MKFFGKLSALLSVMLVTMTLHVSGADIRDASSGEFRGMYKIFTSNDPIFPTQANSEWLLDFGNGISAGKFSGSVAVSFRQNPNVKVRIMAWQYFPKQGSLVIGNPYSESSKNAVAKGRWQISPVSGGYLFERGSYQVVMHRAAPGDY